MSTNAITAAETLDRMARQLEGITEARDAMRKIGPLDNAIAEREARLKALDEEEQARDRQLKDHKAEMAKDRQAIKEALEKAHQEATATREAARADVEAMRAEAETAAREREASAKAKVAQLQKEIDRKNGEIKANEKKAQDAIDAMFQQFQQAEAQAVAAEQRLAAAKQAAADLFNKADS